MSKEHAIEEERRRARRLRVCHDITRGIILSGDLDLLEALDLCRALRKTALDLFPDKGDVYDLIYKPRLDRDIRAVFGSGAILN